jgi:hypothetical protein
VGEATTRRNSCGLDGRRQGRVFSLHWRRLRSNDGIDPSNPTSMAAGPIPHGRRAVNMSTSTRKTFRSAAYRRGLRATSDAHHFIIQSIKNKNIARASPADWRNRPALTTGPPAGRAREQGAGVSSTRVASARRCFRPNRMRAVPPADRTRLHRIFKRLGRAPPTGLPASTGGWPFGTLGRGKPPFFVVVT